MRGQHPITSSIMSRKMMGTFARLEAVTTMKLQLSVFGCVD
jgi:hypothetical protein